MLSAPSFTRPLIRALSAALLALAVFTSLVPFSVLSASHSCSMPCCASVEGGCATGACDGTLFKNPKKAGKEEEKLCGAVGERSHGATKKAHASTPSGAQTDDDHCGAEKDSPVDGSTHQNKYQSRTAPLDKRLKSHYVRSLAAPCSEDCCVAAISGTQPRRGRDSALAPLSGILPAPTGHSLSHYYLSLHFSSSGPLGRLRARAPPPATVI